MVPIGLIVGTYAWIAGANVVSLNDQYVHGFAALITAIGLTFFSAISLEYFGQLSNGLALSFILILSPFDCDTMRQINLIKFKI